MPVILNMDGDIYNQKQTFTIAGLTYRVHTYWNARSGWYVSFYDSNDNPINLGIKLMPNAVLNKYALDDYYSGEIICVDTSPERDENRDLVEGLTLSNFGDGRRYQLVYFTEQEILDL